MPALEDGELAYLRDIGRLIVNSGGQNHEIGAVTLLHNTEGSVNKLSGVAPAQGVYTARFIANADYFEGDTFEINGEGYEALDSCGMPPPPFKEGRVLTVEIDVAGNTINFKAGGKSDKEINDNLPPPVSSLRGSYRTNGFTIEWNNPNSDYFSGVKIVAKESFAPVGVMDGEEVYDGSGTTAEHLYLTSRKKYYYRAFPYNGKGQYQTDVTNSIINLTYP